MFVALDSLLFVWLTLGSGWPGETISSAAYRAELLGGYFGVFRKPVDFLLSWLESNHCEQAWIYAKEKRNLPKDMR